MAVDCRTGTLIHNIITWHVCPGCILAMYFLFATFPEMQINSIYYSEYNVRMILVKYLFSHFIQYVAKCGPHPAIALFHVLTRNNSGTKNHSQPASNQHLFLAGANHQADRPGDGGQGGHQL